MATRTTNARNASAATNWKDSLSEQQRAAVAFVTASAKSLILTARAGCGKTHTVVRGIVREIIEALPPTVEVALMAYNKAAANEFKDRLAAMAESTGNRAFTDWRRVQAGTVHSFGFAILRRWSSALKDRNAINSNKVRDICRRLADETARRDGIEAQVTFWATECASICHLVSLGKQSAIGFVTGTSDRSAWYELVERHAVNDTMGDDTTVDQLVEAAIEVLNISYSMDRTEIDFDDMVIAPLVHKCRIYPKDFVIVDEAQDTNAARRALVLAMTKPRTGRVIAVGDDRQAIYGFTGADADSLDLIAEATGADRLPLTVTYRCPKAVVAAANALVPDLVAHESAPEGAVTSIALSTTSDDDSETPWFLNPSTGLQPTDAVLCRNTKPLIETAYAMLAAGIGCRVEGREIGEGLIKLATRWQRVRTLAALSDKLEDYKAREIAKWMAKENEARAQGIEDKVDALLAIIGALRAQGCTAVADLVAWIRSLFSDSNPDAPTNAVTLCTIHKSKGREWGRVFFLMRDETLPSRYAKKAWQLAQENNLEYVAITRAKGTLVFVD